MRLPIDPDPSRLSFQMTSSIPLEPERRGAVYVEATDENGRGGGLNKAAATNDTSSRDETNKESIIVVKVAFILQ